MSGGTPEKLKNMISDYVRSHRDPYLIFRFLQKFSSEDYYDLVRGYYECSADVSTLVVKHLGDELPDRIVYIITWGERERPNTTGFFAVMRWVLGLLNYADHFGFCPVVKWGEGMPYYDHGMDHITANAFEYYFDAVADVSAEQARRCRNVISGRNVHANFFLPCADVKHSYLLDSDEINALAGIYRKHIRLNRDMREYIDAQIERLLGGRRTLAVHARGTDFKGGIYDHPVVVSAAEYLAEAKRIFFDGGYEQIFLATEDQNTLILFRQAFGDRLAFYDDVARSADTVSPHCKEEARPLHHYLMGREVLRDVYTLARCDSLIAGLSQVSFAARYVNIAEGRKYEVLSVLNKGINTAAEKGQGKSEKYRGGYVNSLHSQDLRKEVAA